jgi:hypothetical protein
VTVEPNFEGTRPPPRPTPAGPGPSKFRGLWIALGLMVLAIALAPWLAPSFTGGDRCHPEALPSVKVVQLDVCVNPADWSWFFTPQATIQSYGAGRDKIYFDSIGFPDAYPADELRRFIFERAHQYATNQETLQVVSEGDVTLGGRTWRRLELASDTSQFVYYYYSAEGFGTVQLFFLGFKDNVRRRDELAAPVLASVTFL